MALEFNSEQELCAWIENICSGYRQYGCKLWGEKVATVRELGLANEMLMHELGIKHLHARHIIAFAGRAPLC